MDIIYLVFMAIGIIVGMCISLYLVQFVSLETAFNFLSRRPQFEHVYEFKFKLSPKHGVFYSPKSKLEFVFSIGQYDNFEEGHYYEYRVNSLIGSQGNSALANPPWCKVAYP